MKKVTKIALIIASVLLISGVILTAGALAAVGFDITALNTEHFSERYYEISEQISSFDIESDNCDIWLTESPDDKCWVTVSDSEYTTTQVEVNNGVLVIRRNELREWYKYLSIGIVDYNIKILVCVPKSDFSDLKLTATSGDIDIPVEFVFDTALIHTTSGSINSKAVVNTEAEFSSTSGSINVQNLNAKTASVGSTSGSIMIEYSEPQKLKVNSTIGNICIDKTKVTQLLEIESTSGDAMLHVIGMEMSRNSTSGSTTLNSAWMQETVKINSTSGDVTLYASDAAFFDINTASGDIEGSILTPKIFVTNTISGNVNIREAQADQSKMYGVGRFEATSTSGDIDIVMVNMDEKLLFTDLDSITIVK